MVPSNRLLMAASVSRGLLLRRYLRGLSTAVSGSSPLLMLPSNEVAETFTPDSKLHLMDYSFYRLSDKQTISLRNKTNGTNPIPHDAFCVGSSKGWLMYSDPADCTLFLTNPLSPSPPTIPLPPVTSLSSVNAFSSCSPHPKYKNQGLKLTNHNHDCLSSEMYTSIIQNFAISGSPESQDCVIMVIQYWTKTVSFCKPASALHNMEEQEVVAWTNLDVDPDKNFHSIMYSSKEKLFYALLIWDCGIVTWDFHGHLEPKREAYRPVFTNVEEADKIRSVGFTSEYLVESSGDILLVWWQSNYVDRDGNILPDACVHLHMDTTIPIKTIGFYVYRLNDAKDSWQYVKSLGDRVLFLGMNEPFSLSASDFPELKPNSIYFVGPGSDESKFSSYDWGIYNLEDDTITRHYPCSYWSKLRPPPIWIDNSITVTNICSTDVASQKGTGVSSTHKCRGEKLEDVTKTTRLPRLCNDFSCIVCEQSANEFTTAFNHGGNIHHCFKPCLVFCTNGYNLMFKYFN